MSKLIPRPGLCAARVAYEHKDDHFCSINGSVFLACSSHFEFPNECPLQDGIPILKTIEELIQVAKEEGLLFDVYKKTGRLQTIILIEKTCQNG